MMKLVLSAAAICLFAFNASASQVCADIPPEIGGIVQANPNGSITVLYPTLKVGNRKFAIIAGSDAAIGVCKLMGKTYKNYEHSGVTAKEGVKLLQLDSEASITGVTVNTSTSQSRYYQMTTLLCK